MRRFTSILLSFVLVVVSICCMAVPASAATKLSKKDFDYYQTIDGVKKKYNYIDIIRDPDTVDFGNISMGTAKGNYSEGYSIINTFGLIPGKSTKADVKRIFGNQAYEIEENTNPDSKNQATGRWDCSHDENGYSIRNYFGCYQMHPNYGYSITSLSNDSGYSKTEPQTCYEVIYQDNGEYFARGFYFDSDNILVIEDLHAIFITH